ncbi:MAG TPA: hypothetical protein P5079_08315 [Elusimicrobiota bacterium]|nr:hypothetical protein [Elusimicrobiota bacterium]
MEKILLENKKDILTGMTFAIKELRGSYERRPIEEIYGHNEIYFKAHAANLLSGDFQPLVDFADMITRKRALDRFRLHELLRASFSFKKVLYPLLVQQCWEDRNELVKSIVALDRSVDRFVVNLSQAFVHYAKDYLARDPLEFPVWLENVWRRVSSEETN